MTATLSAGELVTRHWKTGLIISQVNLSGIINADPAAEADNDGTRCQVLPPGSLPGLDLLRGHFLTSMNALANAEDAPGVTGCHAEVQIWRDGYDQPAFSSQARYAGWTILAASPAPGHSESGCLAFADPRAGSAGTAMPGLPWGRQFLLTPVPGAHATVPGWLTCSLVPLEHGQHITIAVAYSNPPSPHTEKGPTQ
jgi:hypothetical protein